MNSSTPPAGTPASARPSRTSFMKVVLTVALVSYTLVLITATHLPTVGGFVRYPGIDKLLHLLAYGVLASLAAALATFGWGGKPQRLFALGCLLAGFGMLDELTQPMFGRQAEAADWLADCLGITGGILGVLLLQRWLGRHFQQGVTNDG